MELITFTPIEYRPLSHDSFLTSTPFFLIIPITMSSEQVTTLRNLCRKMYEVQKSVEGPTIEGQSSAFLVANEDRFNERGLEINVPWWRRDQLESVLATPLPGELIRKVEEDIVPDFLKRYLV